MHGVGHRFLAGARRTDEQQRFGAARLPRDGVAEGANRRALADQRAVHTAARMAQEILRDAQLAFQRLGPFRDPRFERRIGCLQRLGRAPSFVVKLCVTDGARDLVRDDRHQVAVVFVERLPHGALDREDSNQFVADEERNRDLALCVRQAGDRHGVADLHSAPRLHHLTALRRGVGTLLSEVVQLQHLSPLGDDADGANADADAAADRLILVAPAGDDAQRLTVSFEQGG